MCHNKYIFLEAPRVASLLRSVSADYDRFCLI